MFIVQKQGGGTGGVEGGGVEGVNRGAGGGGGILNMNY